MQSKKIEKICCLAHDIDPRVNLFQGFSPKETDSYSGELLFWRQIVSLYGLFTDSDRAQVKEKKNLIELLSRYNLIERSDYNMALKLWDDVSELRKWFCHNNDPSLYYADNRQKKIKNYLNSAFGLSTKKPEKIEEIQAKDWGILTFNIDSRFQAYLEILEKGLLAWKDSEYKSDLLDEWITILAKSLFLDKNLIQNVLADVATYEKRNQGITNMTVPQLAMSYLRQLENGDFSENDIERELKQNNSPRSNKEIVSESIRNSHLI